MTFKLRMTVDLCMTVDMNEIYGNARFDGLDLDFKYACKDRPACYLIYRKTWTVMG